MNRALRVQQAESRTVSYPTIVSAAEMFTADYERRMLEAEQRSSERRFDKVQSPEATAAIGAAVDDFAERNGLQVVVTSAASEIPDVPPGFRFKYTRRRTGSLGEALDDLEQGRKVVVALVWEEEAMIGYGIARPGKKGTEIEIIDVERHSRRPSGLQQEVVIAGETFTVGVGHVVVRALIRHLPGKLKTDATTDGSRFIFKSLGFVHQGVTNPCLLELIR